MGCTECIEVPITRFCKRLLLKGLAQDVAGCQKTGGNNRPVQGEILCKQIVLKVNALQRETRPAISDRSPGTHVSK